MMSFSFFKTNIIFISSSRGDLESEISINGKEFSLTQFEPQIKNIGVANEKSIRFTLNVIKKFIEMLED